MTSQPWPITMRDKLGDQLIPTLAAIKATNSLNEFNAIIAPFGFTMIEHAIALQQSQVTIGAGPQREQRVGRTKFYAAAWYCGAAYRQMGRILGISHQSVHTSAGRILGLNPQRLLPGPITDEQCAALYQDWQQSPSRNVHALVDDFSIIITKWEN
jgi:hypothetical protein